MREKQGQTQECWATVRTPSLHGNAVSKVLLKDAPWNERSNRITLSQNMSQK